MKKARALYKTTQALIAAFGEEDSDGTWKSGRIVVAELTGALPQAVSNWYKAGVPFKFHRTLVRLAEEKNVAGVTDEVLAKLRPSPPSKSAKISPTTTHQHAA